MSLKARLRHSQSTLTAPNLLVRPPLRLRWRLAVAASLVLIGVLLGWGFGPKVQAWLQERLPHAQQPVQAPEPPRLEDLEVPSEDVEPPGITFAEAELLRTEILRLQVETLRQQADLELVRSERDLERGRAEAMAAELQASQELVINLRDDLNFFETLLPAGDRRAAAGIRAAEFTQQAQTLSYRILVMRVGRTNAEFQGEVRIELRGTLRGRAHTLEPPPSLPLQFAQYQRLEGELALPEGFEPSRATLRLRQGNRVIGQHQVDF